MTSSSSTALRGTGQRPARSRRAPVSSSSRGAATDALSRPGSPPQPPTPRSWSSSTATAVTPPNSFPRLIAPIAAGRAVFVLGSRVRGARERGSLAPQQIAAAHVGSLLLRLIYGARFSDLSPFRAIRRDALERLGMREPTYGWNLEMLMRLAATGLPAMEVAVGQRRRIGGVSKVSGNFTAGIAAAWSMAATFIRLALRLRREKQS